MAVEPEERPAERQGSIKSFAIQTPPARLLILHGVVAGVVSGSIFLLAQMVLSLLLGGSFMGPLRLYASVLLGPGALQASYPQIPVSIVGALLVYLVSAAAGIIFIYLLLGSGQLTASKRVQVILGLAFGIALGSIGWILLPASSPLPRPLWTVFAACALFFGLPLGWYVARLNPGNAVR